MKKIKLSYYWMYGKEWEQQIIKIGQILKKILKKVTLSEK
jgi:hypothetical protein